MSLGRAVAVGVVLAVGLAAEGQEPKKAAGPPDPARPRLRQVVPPDVGIGAGPVDGGPGPVPRPTAPAIRPEGPSGPTPMALDFKDRTVAEAIRALGVRSGGLVGLSGVNDPRWSDRRITLEAPRPVPLLEAADRLAATASLQASVTFTGPFGSPRRQLVFQATGPGPADDGPWDYPGPFRLGPVVVHEWAGLAFQRRPGGATPTRPAFYAEVPILAEPGLLYLRNGPPRVAEAVDELGQSYLDGATPWADWPGGAREPAGFRIGLVRPPGPAKGLASLRGSLPLELGRRPVAPTSTIPLAGSAGKTFRDGDLSITVAEFKEGGGGPVTVRLVARLEGRRAGGPARHRDDRLWSAYFHQLELADAGGDAVPLVGGATTADGTLAINATYPPGPPGSKGSPPATLRIYRPDWVEWDLPFAFRDLPLP